MNNMYEHTSEEGCDYCGINPATFLVEEFVDEGGSDFEATCKSCGTKYYRPACGQCCGEIRTDPDGKEWIWGYTDSTDYQEYWIPRG